MEYAKPLVHSVWLVLRLSWLLVRYSRTLISLSRLTYVLRRRSVGDHPKTAEAIARKINLMIGDTKESLSAKTGRSVREIYEDEVSAVVIHGDDIDSLEGWQWDLSGPETLLRHSTALTCDVIQSLVRKRSCSRGRRPNTNLKSVRYFFVNTWRSPLTVPFSQACTGSGTHRRSVSAPYSL
jgi:hypothetical protein